MIFVYQLSKLKAKLVPTLIRTLLLVLTNSTTQISSITKEKLLKRSLLRERNCGTKVPLLAYTIRTTNCLKFLFDRIILIWWLLCQKRKNKWNKKNNKLISAPYSASFYFLIKEPKGKKYQKTEWHRRKKKKNTKWLVLCYISRKVRKYITFGHCSEEFHKHLLCLVGILGL